MNFFTATLIVAAVAVLSLGGMWLGWRKRGKQSEAIVLPEQSGTVIDTFKQVFYVATTRVGEPLVRVNVPALTYRGYAEIHVMDTGVTIRVRGEHAVTIPINAITDTSTARTRIDKAVEKDGLTTLTWSWGDDRLESSLRFTTANEQRAFQDAVTQIIQPATKEDA